MKHATFLEHVESDIFAQILQFLSSSVVFYLFLNFASLVTAESRVVKLSTNISPENFQEE